MAEAKENQEEKIVLTEEDKVQAKAMIDELIKPDKNKMMALSILEGVLSSTSEVTSRFAVLNFSLLAGQIATNAASGNFSGIMDMVNYYVQEKIRMRSDVKLHQDFDGRSRAERSSLNPEKTIKLSDTISESAAQYMIRKNQMRKALITTAVGGMLAVGGGLSAPIVAGSVLLAGTTGIVVAQNLLYKKLKDIRVKCKSAIDDARKELNSYSREMYKNSKMIENNNAQDFAYDGLKKRQKKYLKSVWNFTKATAKYFTAVKLPQALCSGAALAIGISSGMGIIPTVALTGGIMSIVSGVNNVQNAYYGKKEFVETFATAYKKFKSKFKDFNFGLEKIQSNANVIEMDKIAHRFRDKDGNQAKFSHFLSDEKITFKPGISVLSGVSGAGKSTLTELLLHADNLSRGSIKIGTLDSEGNFTGQDYKNLVRGEPCKNIAISLQKPELIECSVDAYIKLGNPHASAKKVKEVKELLHIGKKKGWIDEKKVLSSESNLSGGELARLSLAQALIKDSPIMILDEPTSGVDEKMSDDIVNYIKSLKNKTIIYITHDAREIDKIGAYQAVDIDQQKKTQRAKRIKSYDLTIPRIKQQFIELFMNRETSEKSKQEEKESNKVLEPNIEEKKNAQLAKIHERQQALIAKRSPERITAGEPLSPKDLIAFKKIKGISAQDAERQTAILFEKIAASNPHNYN